MPAPLRGQKFDWIATAPGALERRCPRRRPAMERRTPCSAGAPTADCSADVLSPASFGEHSSPLQMDRVEREIASTDAQIGELVYELYGITDEERKIIEGP